MKNHKTSQLQAILTAVFVGALLISNIIAAKQFQLPFGITMTGAVLIFPITYILSDLFSEVYGYRWSRITCYTAFAMNIVMAIVFALAIATPAPGYWQNQEGVPNSTGQHAAYTWRIIAGVYSGGLHKRQGVPQDESKNTPIRTKDSDRVPSCPALRGQSWIAQFS